MKVKVIPTVIDALGTVTIGLVLRLEDMEIRERVEIIQTTTSLRSDRILRRVLETSGDSVSIRFQWKTISKRWCEKHFNEKIMIIIVIKVIHWEMCKKFKFDHTNKCYMHNSAPVLENNEHKLLWDFNIQTDHLIPARRPDLIIINKKKKQKNKENLQNCQLCCPVNHRINMEECEKKDKYLDLARELKKLWNMKVTIVPIVIGVLGTMTKGLLKGLGDLEVGGRLETIQMTALLRTARILRPVLETWGDLLSLRLQWKTSS